MRMFPLFIILLLLVCGDVELNPGPTLGDKPTLPDLLYFKYNDISGTQHKIHIIDTVASRWRRLGIALKCDSSILNNIGHNNTDVEDCCMKLMERWLQGTVGDGPVTWETLVEAIDNARYGELAKQLKRVLSHCATPHIPNPTQSTPTTLSPNHISTYQQYLKDEYKKEYPDYSKPQFTINRPKQIVNLVLVHKEKNEVDELQKQCLLYQLHGNVDLIQQKKTPLAKDKVGLLPNGEAVGRVLIEGAPGIGKTTFMWQLCHQWSVGELLQQWELVILVQLREETARTAQCLSDLLYHPRHNITQAVCHEIEEREGEKVLLMFDGYDELSDDQRIESIFKKLLSKQQVRGLRKATVVVSSRPFATKTLPHQFKNSLDQHVEIVGFGEKDIDTYLTSACVDNPDLLKDLKSYISSSTFISSILYNPLHCTIVTELYLQYWQGGKRGFAPSTMTQLYDALLLNLLRRQQNNDNIENLSQLPPDVQQQLNQLAELAALGVEKRMYIFHNVPCDTLGLMHSVRHLHDNRPNRSTCFCFTHLTLQEYLAAYHWSQLPPKQLIELLQQQDLLPICKYLRVIQRYRWAEESIRMTHWPVLLLFLAGLTQFTSIPPELITPWTDQLLNDSSSTCSSPNDKPIKFHPSLCQLLFESQSPQLVSTVVSKIRIEPDKFEIYSPFDWFVTGYCITYSDTSSLWNVEFDYNSPQCLQAFSSGLHYSSTNTHKSMGNGTIEKLRIATVYHVSEYLKVFPNLYPYTEAITNLSLRGWLHSGDGGVPVLQQLSHYCPRLRELTLPEFHPPYLSLVPQLPQDTLHTLRLTLPLMKDDSDCVLVPHLLQCQALKHFIVSAVNRETDITSLLIGISPVLAGQIEELRLSNVSINSGCVEVLIHTLTSPHSRLLKLELTYYTISSSDYCHLTTAILTSNLTLFTTTELGIDVSSAKGLARALTQSKTLEVVYVWEHSMNNEVAQILLEAMNHSSVKELRIGHVSKDAVSGCSYPTDKVVVEYYQY